MVVALEAIVEASKDSRAADVAVVAEEALRFVRDSQRRVES